MRAPIRSLPALLLTLGALLGGASTARADAPISADPAAPAGPNRPPPNAAPAPGDLPRAADGTPAVASCKTDPCAGECACAQRCCSKCGCSGPKAQLSITGVRVAVTNVSTQTVHDSTFGVGFAGAADAYALDGTTHAASTFMLGGGQGGFEGMLAGTIDVGYRLPVADDHGPFGRIGFEGRLQGNDLLYYSLLELPRLTLGWQYLKGKTVIEGGARGGVILAGLYDPGDDGRRKLNGFEWGGFASAQLDFLKLEASFMQIEATRTLDGTPVDVGSARLCGVLGKGGVCLDGTLFRGHADLRNNAAGIHNTTAEYVGLTVGFVGW